MTTRAKITVVKRVVHQDLIDEYMHDELKAAGAGICTRFVEGQEFMIDVHPACPEGFCSWAWADIQRDVTAVLWGNGFPWVGPENTAITCCTDGFRPVTFKVERIEDGDDTDGFLAG